MADYAKLYQALGYQFQQEDLLTLALTHRSFSGSRNNERLEFLGDSILNFVIGKALFDKFPHLREGQLSRMRSALVREEALAELGNRFALDRFVKVGPGELKTGGRRRASLIADATEAIIGALFEEAGFEICRERVLSWYAETLDTLRPVDNVKDNKTRLQEALQAARRPLPVYEVLDVQVNNHQRRFAVTCTLSDVGEHFEGEGDSRRQAEQVAAGRALAYLAELASD